MKSLRVVAEMASGLVALDGLDLASLVALEVLREAHPEGLPDPKSEGVLDCRDYPVPFDLRGDGDQWWYACSDMQGKPLADAKDHFHSRIDTDRAVPMTTAGKIAVTYGRYKPTRLPVYAKLYRRVWWWCVGDDRELRRLLDGVTNLGKFRGHGYGHVGRWNVLPMRMDLSESSPKGCVTRALPRDYCETHGLTGDPAICTVHPPRWDRRFEVDALVPRRAG